MKRLLIKVIILLLLISCVGQKNISKLLVNDEFKDNIIAYVIINKMNNDNTKYLFSAFQKIQKISRSDKKLPITISYIIRAPENSHDFGKNYIITIGDKKYKKTIAKVEMFDKNEILSTDEKEIIIDGKIITVVIYNADVWREARFSIEIDLDQINEITNNKSFTIEFKCGELPVKFVYKNEYYNAAIEVINYN